jgi:hypothetical protein
VGGVLGAEPGIGGWTLVIVAIVTAVAPTIAALGAWRSAGKANKAVNNRPDEGPTISDDVATIRTVVSKLEDDHDAIKGRLDSHLGESRQVWRRLDDHIREHPAPRRRGW